MTQKTKAELTAELSRYLLVNVHWERLSEEDLMKLCEAFEKLRVDVERVFRLIDEITGEAPLAPSEDKGELKRYII